VSFNKSWKARDPLGNVAVTWTPTPPHLFGERVIVNAVIEFLSARPGGISLTPTGPLVPATVSDPFAVAFALFDLFPEIDLSDAPDAGSLWADDLPKGDDVVF
jgi:hypothetical protein